jgi:Rrf2 family nitric oxide-sensitive transcriptional repressor
MFSQTAEYALRAAVYLASQQGVPRTTQEIAKATQVKIAYLSKVMQNLARQGLVQSQRGLHGGFTLARPADELTILDILRAVAPIPRITSCPLGIQGHMNLCLLHRRLDQAMKLVEEALGRSTLAELLAEPERTSGVPLPLCPWPHAKCCT